ncbi:MAG: Gfo/Idh/MocA family oxidoreductase [Ruminococcus sp.]|nr:Gfo/Idh/MocA family oxidoreductase [Ruminococcus sp.]
MKVCFIGLGSIARRHISNLKNMLGTEISIDVLRSGNGNKLDEDFSKKLANVCYSSEELSEKYDAIFITNPTSMHYETLKKYLDKSDNFFIEKPVFETGEEDVREFINTDKVFYVACPLRYSNVIQYLKKNIDFSKVYSVRCISSSYLPDWRPGTDYRNTYSAHKELGGGVSIDLIHEWDYIHYLIGSPNYVKSIISKKSNLDINSDDVAVYIAEYNDKIVELHLDYFGRETIRRIELYTEDDTIFVDLINQKVKYLRSGKEVDLSQDRNEFQTRELQHFIDIINGKEKCDNDLYEACGILRITRGY